MVISFGLLVYHFLCWSSSWAELTVTFAELTLWAELDALMSWPLPWAY